MAEEMNEEQRRNLMKAKELAGLAATAMFTLVDALNEQGLERRLWPIPEIHEARVALRRVRDSPKDALTFAVRERAEDQERLLSAQSRVMMVADAAYWRACALAWRGWSGVSE